MGLSLTNTHIHNLANLTKPQFKKTLTDMMKAKGYTKATEDDAAVSFSLVFTKNRKWVTVLGDDVNSAELAKNLDLQVLSVELVDSDFAELKLHTTEGAADILMLGRPYMEEYPQPTPDKWQSILGESTWSQVEEIQSGDHTFAEDALAEFGALIGLGENILLENGDIPESADVMHFKKSGIATISFELDGVTYKMPIKVQPKKKKVTINAVFKQVFGSALEERGFVKAKSKYPYYIKVVNNDILYVVSFKDDFFNDTSRRSLFIISGIETLYRNELRFDKKPCSDDGLYYYTELGANHVIISYKKDDPDSMAEAMKIKLDEFLDVVYPKYQRVTDLKAAAGFFDKTKKSSMRINTCDDNFGNDDSNESLLYFLTDLDDEYYEAVIKNSEERLLKELKEDDLTESQYKERLAKSTQYTRNKRELIENIKNDSERLKKYMSEAERRKKKNTAVLKDLGLYDR